MHTNVWKNKKNFILQWLRYLSQNIRFQLNILQSIWRFPYSRWRLVWLWYLVYLCYISVKPSLILIAITVGRQKSCHLLSFLNAPLDQSILTRNKFLKYICGQFSRTPNTHIQGFARWNTVAPEYFITINVNKIGIEFLRTNCLPTLIQMRFNS